MMKKKNTVLLLGISSILILISVQVYIIIGVWKQKNEMFTLRYSQLSQEAGGWIRYAYSNGIIKDDGFDMVRELLNDSIDKVVDDLFKIDEPAILKEREKGIFEYVKAVLNREQVMSSLLSSYFESRGFEKNFKFRININNVEILNSDTLVVYRSDRFQGRRSGGRGQSGTSRPSESSISSEIPVGRTLLEGNHYRVFFDYLIDFSDKRKIVMREISASLLLGIFSIVLVGIMFMTTYRNLMEERRLSNLKTDFINNMTHELKTPLSTITVAGRTLEMPQIRQNDEKILETAKMIGKQSVHLNQLINMILEISMWERTQFQLDKKRVDMEDVMNDVVSSFKSGGGNSATIIEKYNLTGVTAEIDVVYFTTLLNNLLSNAVKYSDKTPVIEIEGFREDNNICIKVSDNGIGINKIDQKHIFDKFYRATTGNIHKFKGLGLGLYYVKKIAEAHGGDVNVNSRPGKGSTFTVTLPGIS
ncbi:MAG TPA: HAMP domain-containing sensor histidine kinase [Bacteroidales bacterium]|nr:HAMP domain-containing sensor histidine kinase [Bacteroidales bacterium]